MGVVQAQKLADANEAKKIADAEIKRAKLQEDKAKKAGDAVKHALKVCAEQKLSKAEAVKAKQQKLDSAAARHEQALNQKKQAVERFARLMVEQAKAKKAGQTENLSAKIEQKLSAASQRKEEQQSQRLAFNKLLKSRTVVVHSTRAKAEQEEEDQIKLKAERQQRAEAVRSTQLTEVSSKAAQRVAAAKEISKEQREQREKEIH